MAEKTDHYGYYVFLGLGDFPVSSQLSPEWTSTWDLSEWKKRLTALRRLGTNTLFIYLMGHRLPYRSDHYPECLETDHPNVKKDFFQGVLDAALDNNMELVAVFSTTGHACGYLAAHPELSKCDREGRLMADDGILCHHKDGAWEYSANVIAECLTRYQGFNGVMLHPPEFRTPCFCEACQKHFRALYNKHLLEASLEEAQFFFMQTNLSLQKTILESKIKQLLPKAQQLVFTIPWVFEKHFEEFGKEIAPETIIVSWDYRLAENHVKLLPERLKRYEQFGHKVWFMPTSGYGVEEQGKNAPKMVLRQIELSLAADIKDVVYFMGPQWWPAVEKTSLHLHGTE